MNKKDENGERRRGIKKYDRKWRKCEKVEDRFWRERRRNGWGWEKGRINKRNGGRNGRRKRKNEKESNCYRKRKLKKEGKRRMVVGCRSKGSIGKRWGERRKKKIWRKDKRKKMKDDNLRKKKNWMVKRWRKKNRREYKDW